MQDDEAVQARKGGEVGRQLSSEDSVEIQALCQRRALEVLLPQQKEANCFHRGGMRARTLAHIEGERNSWSMVAIKESLSGWSQTNLTSGVKRCILLYAQGGSG